MARSEKWKSALFVVGLIVLGVALGAAGFVLLEKSSPSDPAPQELAKALMNLGVVVILGSLLKLLLDEYRKGAEHREEERAFRQELLQALRSIFDQVELARVLIESHRSAKTYGECIRDKIIPAKISLYDIKRTLADASDSIEGETATDLRAWMHFMIAYLHQLVDEYASEYREIANQQAYQEAVAARSRRLFAESFPEGGNASSRRDALRGVPDQLSAAEPTIPPALTMVWQRIEALPRLADFRSNESPTAYQALFLRPYECCKAKLKSRGKHVERGGMLPHWEEIRKGLSGGEGVPEDLVAYLVERLAIERFGAWGAPTQAPANPA
ncbi:MAG: hypothetical protein QNK03_09235 [Myxococcota bacterium]|nr:hypothetical protein [Myxococcota bacterium]